MLQLLIGIAVTIATWLAVRQAVGAPLPGTRGAGPIPAVMVDALPPMAAFALFLLPTGRPLLAALGVAALGFGLGIADREKRRILDEPVVFADRAELIEVVRHPRLYLGFIGLGGAIMVASAIAAAIGGMLWLEPPLWPIGVARFTLAALGAALIGRLCFILPGLAAGGLARRYATLPLTRRPEDDARRLGPFTTLIAHATIARAERPGRRATAIAATPCVLQPGQGPIVLIQGESFVHAGRLEPALVGQLPHFEALARDGAASGPLAVPCWGANTIRSELAVLAGLDDAALGLDRFNPYEAFARVPLPTLASAARAAGYATIFLHPYNRTFYGRHKVAPCLGFDRFIGLEGFAGAATDAGYVTDAAVTAHILELLKETGPDCLIFVVTMENHGPWDGAHDPLPPVPLPPAWATLPDADAIGRWLRHAQATDAMIPPLRAALEGLGRGWLAFYGDHQPSLGGPFRAGSPAERHTDYAIWSPGCAPGAHRPLAAHDLAATLCGLINSGASEPRSAS